MKNLLFAMMCLIVPVMASAQKVYSVDYASQAGWRNKSKKQVMY